MVTRFGSREICDVTFKATKDGQKIGNETFEKGQPVFIIDTATASSMEQATTTVYAQGGKGYNRLIAWEGEKTVTFNVTDALISPMGLAMLTGAGIGDASDENLKHIHMTYDVTLDEDGVGTISAEELENELGVVLDEKLVAFNVCAEETFRPYATVLDSNGAVVGWVKASDIALSGQEDGTKGWIAVDKAHDLTITIESQKKQTIKLDFYVVMNAKATQIVIAPEHFGGTFYVEADTLYRNQDGIDMAATLTFPKAKIQSGFTLSMAPTGDPSTFDFVMDAMPGYTYFDHSKKVVCDIVVVGDDAKSDDGEKHVPHSKN